MVSREKKTEEKNTLKCTVGSLIIYTHNLFFNLLNPNIPIRTCVVRTLPKEILQLTERRYSLKKYISRYKFLWHHIFSKKIIHRSESVLDIEITIERNFQHYLLKIMLPVFLILCVAWYVLWIPTEKYEARLNTSIIALLALIAYNFVFQDDIPKLEYLTDMDWFILLSYIFCCIQLVD